MRGGSRRENDRRLHRRLRSAGRRIRRELRALENALALASREKAHLRARHRTLEAYAAGAAGLSVETVRALLRATRHL